MTNIAIAIVSLLCLWERSFPEGQLSFNITFIASRNHFQHAQLMPNSSHAILFTLISPVVLNLLELWYQGKAVTPFDTHPKTMSFGIACFLAYCLAYGFELNCFVSWLSPTHAPTLRSSMVVFGSLSSVSFLSILFPDSVQPILFRLCIAVDGVSINVYDV